MEHLLAFDREQTREDALGEASPQQDNIEYFVRERVHCPACVEWMPVRRGEARAAIVGDNGLTNQRLAPLAVYLRVHLLVQCASLLALLGGSPAGQGWQRGLQARDRTKAQYGKT